MSSPRPRYRRSGSASGAAAAPRRPSAIRRSFTLTQQLGHYNNPYFDATDPEDRNNLQVTGNVTWYRPTESFGSHNIKMGYESYRSTRTGGNSQTSTGYVFDADYLTDANGDPVLENNRLIPVFSPFQSLIENWLPSRGARININTESFFINDNWTLNEHFSFNMGVRGEFVSSDATPGDITTVDTRAIVPRLAASYDPLGDGRYSIQATYSHYSGKYSEAQFAENTNVGNPSLLLGGLPGSPACMPGSAQRDRGRLPRPRPGQLLHRPSAVSRRRTSSPTSG